MSSTAFHSVLEDSVRTLATLEADIPEARRDVLRDIAQWIAKRCNVGERADLVFICTHNSRRSHISQIWARALAWKFGLGRVRSFSGGTEATAFHPNAIRALRELGFSIELKEGGDNPRYTVSFAGSAPTIEAFSKTFNDSFNPSAGFAAIMTCNEADEACPVVPGAAARFSLPSIDPKHADGTEQETAEYRERSLRIGAEMLFLMRLASSLVAEDLKNVVREKYAMIAEQSRDRNASSCCGATSSCCGDGMTYTIMADDYSGRAGYVEDADLGLGCGIPTDAARLRPGMTVLDLGSGAGNDAFIAARSVGDEGMVIGVDMTEAMIAKANENKIKVGARNVDFRLGEIEALPVDSDSVDVILSNCVLNLVPDKRAAFTEMRRVLKSNGHFAVSDIVHDGDMPPALKSVAELYAGCVSGAIHKDEYLALIAEAGFTDVEICKEKTIDIPEDVLREVASTLPDDVATLNATRLLSVTVRARKP